MGEHRRFHRVRFTAEIELVHRNIAYKGQLENLSLNGALISFDEGIIVPQNDECDLTVRLAEDALLRLEVKAIYSNFTMIGVKFTRFDAGTRERLYSLMERISNEPARLSKEQQLLEREEG